VAIGILVLAGAGETALDVGARLVALAFVAAVAAVVHGWAPLVPASLGLLGAAYAVRLEVDGLALDGKAPFFAAGAVLAVELAYWSIEEREQVRADAGEDLRRAGFLAVLTLAALAASGVLLVVGDRAGSEGLAVDLLGAAAAAAALLVVFLAARRPEQPRQ
jgi:hypothetical protein